MEKQSNSSSSSVQSPRKGKRPSRRRRDRGFQSSGFIRENLFKIAVGLLVLAGAVFFLWPKTSAPTASRDSEPAKIKSDFEVALTSGTSEELIRHAKAFDRELYQKPPLPIPEQITLLDKKLKVGRRLEELNETEEFSLKGVTIQLEMLTYLNTLNEVHSLNNQTVEGELNVLAKRLYDSPDSKLRYNSRLAISLGDLHRYLKSGERKDFDTFLESYLATDIFDHQLNTLPAIRRIMAFIEQAGNPEHYQEFKGLLKTRLLASDRADKRKLGEKLHDSQIIGTIDYPDLNQRIMSGEPGAIEELVKIVDKLSQDMNISEIPIVKTISLVESLEDVELERQLSDKLRQTLSLPISKEKKERIQSTFVDYDVRVGCVGKPFDFGESKNISGELLSTALQGSKTTVVIFFSGKNKESLWAINLVDDYQFLTRNGVSWVLLNADGKQKLSTLQKVKTKYRDAEVSHVSIASDLCQKCPVTKVPYIIVIHNGIVVKKNVNPEKLRTTLEELAMSDQ